MNDSIKVLWQRLNDISLIHWLIASVFAIFPIFFYLIRLVKLDYKLGKNLWKKVYFLKTNYLKNLQNERDLLDNIGLFRLEKDIKDISQSLNALQNIHGACVFVVGYDSNFNKYAELFKYAKTNKCPVIIYANSGEIRNPSHRKIFNEYIYSDVANSPNRIAVILLNILMIAK